MRTFFPTSGILLLALAASVAAAQNLDSQLIAALSSAGFTGTVGSSIEARLGRPIDKKLAHLGRLLFFDKIASLHSDNACRRLPFTDGRFRGHAIDCHRNPEQQHGEPEPFRPAQPASHTLGGQFGVLPQADVERTLLRDLGKSFR